MSQLDALFRPASVAVIVGSNERMSLGQMIIKNIVDGGFKGKLFPIGASVGSINSLQTYKDISKITENVGLAIVCDPDKKTIEKCIKKGIRAIIATVSHSGGLSESEWSMLIEVAGTKALLIGPNSIGISNHNSGVMLNASLTSSQMLAGDTALITESGMLGQALINYAVKTGVKMSLFASIGDAPNVSLTDILRFCEQDEETKIILLNTSSMFNDADFAQTCRRVGRTKPIVMLRPGSSTARRSLDPEIGANIEYELNINELFHQCGIHRANSVAELFAIAKAFSACPIPNGDRIGVVSNDGGSQASLESACRANDLNVISTDGSVVSLNPTADEFARALKKASANNRIDVVLASVVSPIPTGFSADVTQIAMKASEKSKAIVGVFDSETAISGIPVFQFPDKAAAAIAALVRQSQFAGTEATEAETYPVTREIAESVIDGVLVENRKDLTLPEAMMVLDAYGINVPRYSYAKDLEEALTAAHGIGYPVSMRLLSKDLFHKPDIGSVFANVKDADELTSDFLTLISRAQRHQLSLDGILIQEATGNGPAVSLSVFNDTEFGRLLQIGSPDRTNAVPCVPPLASTKSKSDHGEMSMIEGSDLLKETVQRLSQLAADFTAIRQIVIDRFVISHEPESIKLVNVQINLR